MIGIAKDNGVDNIDLPLTLRDLDTVGGTGNATFTNVA